MSSCPQCGSTSLSQEDSSTVCTNCGRVVSESNITSDVTFAEGGDGTSNVVGQFVGDMGATTSRSMRSVSNQRQHREVTMTNGRRRIMHLASALKLGSSHVDEALRFFMLAVQHNFTQGRRTHNVIGACLYLVCRRHKTPHMLIDFSDALQANLFILGNTFFKLCVLLKFTPPLIDPSLYIHRFAASLQLGTHELTVANTALRIIQRMKRDWMQIGRRPAGVCGASLFIASRIHRVAVEPNLILRTVKICDITLRRRISEFKNLPASQDTFEEFLKKNPVYMGSAEDDLTDDTSEDPPIFKLHRQREAEAARKKAAEAAARESLAQLVDAAEGESPQTAQGVSNGAQATNGATNGTTNGTATDGNVSAPKPTSNRKKRGAEADPIDVPEPKRVVDASQINLRDTRLEKMPPPATTGPKLSSATEAAALSDTQDAFDEVIRRQSGAGVVDSESAFGQGVEEQMAQTLQQAEDSAISSLSADAVNAPPLVIPGTGTDSQDVRITQLAPPPEEDPLEYDASDIADEEVDEYINTPDQIALKEALWMELHSEYLDEQAEKARIEEQMRAEGREPPKKRGKGRRGAANASGTGPHQGGLSDEILIEPPKERSKKLNYEALDRAKARQLLASASTKDFISMHEDEIGDEDEDDEALLHPHQRPAPSQFLTQLKPTLPDPKGTQGTTQTTNLYDDDDDFDDDDAEDDNPEYKRYRNEYEPDEDEDDF